MKVSKYGHLCKETLKQIIMCKCGFHTYKHVKIITLTLGKMYCEICEKEFCINIEANTLLPWDSDFDTLENI